MTDTSHLSCLDRASLVRREPLACPIFTTLARSSARTRELLEGGRHTVYEGRVDSKQWEFHLHVGATPFGRAILFDLGDV